MKRPHLLRVEDEADSFGPLVAAARAGGIRVGWLDLRAAAPPPALESPARLGVLRAVAAGGGRTVAVKPLRGDVVLRDLLREHFLGCGLVLVVAGPPELPLIEADDRGWRVTAPGGQVRRLSTDRVIALLRRPHPLGSGAPGSRPAARGG